MMKFGDQTVIIKGVGNCSECGALFSGEPMTTFNKMKRHQQITGHDVWNGKPMDLRPRLIQLGIVMDEAFQRTKKEKNLKGNATIGRIIRRLLKARNTGKLTADLLDKSMNRMRKI